MTHRYPRYLGLTGICIASFLGCIDLTVVNTILPAIGRDFAVPIQDTQWVTSIFMVALSAFMVPAGTLADHYGRRRLLLAGLVTFRAASLLAGLAHDFWPLVAYRFLQGIGCAIIYTTSGAIVSHLFGEAEQGKAMGILFGANGIGLAIGPIIGGLFAGALDWHDTFLINIPFIAVSLALCLYAVPESRDERPRRVDVAGCVLLAIGLIALVNDLSLDTPGRHGWLLPIAAGALALFARHELRTRDPIIEFHFFREPRFVSALVATSVLAFFYCAVLLTLPIFLSSQLGKSDIEIGLLLLPATVAFSATSSWVGARSERIGPSRLIVTGLALFVVAAVLLAVAGAAPEPGWLAIALVLFGIGWGAILGPSTLVALGALPREKLAVAMGTSWTLHNVGGAAGIAFAALVLRGAGDFGSHYRTLMIALAAIVVVAAGLYRLLSARAAGAVAQVAE
ncbi:MAG: Antiseptic resistance protein [Burkholderia plantarii]|nr:MAG: Antiseptic resistance protein [Burkholderia plantarii]